MNKFNYAHASILLKVFLGLVTITCLK